MMEETIIVKGRMADPTHIELEEPLTVIQGKIEIAIRLAHATQARKDIRELVLAFPAGKRTKQDIDRQVDSERSAWERS